MDATDQEIISLSYQMSQNFQNKRKNAQNKVNNGMLKTESFHGAGSRNIELDNHNGKMFIPKPLCKNVIDWYHTYY